MHARQLRAHVDALAARRYPTAFRPAAPFTVLFVPSDGFLTTALEAEPGLLEYGFSRDVVLATPSTLLALLRTVAYSWRQERLARDADQVLEVGRRLHARLSTLSGHLTRLGSALGTTMTRFNETVGSYERSVLTAARRFDDLGVAESPVPDPRARRGDGAHAASAGAGREHRRRGPDGEDRFEAGRRLRRRGAGTAPAADPPGRSGRGVTGARADPLVPPLTPCRQVDTAGGRFGPSSAVDAPRSLPWPPRDGRPGPTAERNGGAPWPRRVLPMHGDRAGAPPTGPSPGRAMPP